MPGGDRTGPLGEGPMTGRGMGPCKRGMRMGFGRGFKRFGFRNAGFDEIELDNDQQIKILEADKETIEAKLKELKDAKAKIEKKD